MDSLAKRLPFFGGGFVPTILHKTPCFPSSKLVK